MLDKIMVIILFFLIITLVVRYFKEEKTTCQEGFQTQNPKDTLRNVLQDNTKIDKLSEITSGLGDKKVMHNQTLSNEGIIQRWPKPWKSDIEWNSSNQPDKTSDTSYNVYWNTHLKSNAVDGVTDPSGYVLRCVDLIKERGKKYARIDASGCYGSDEIIELTDVNKGNLLTIEVDDIHNKITGPQQRDGYNNITCSIVNEDNKWICASNCVFAGSIAAGSGNNTGNNNIIDMASDEEKSSGKTWRTAPVSGVVKHNEFHRFKCNAGGGMYAQAGSPDIEPRKCLFGKMQEPLPKDRLNCGDAGIIRGCQVVTDVNDKSCIPEIKEIDGKFYKYCPILCNSEGLGGANKCTKHSQCRNHLFKRELNDREKNVPWPNPFETDALGYNRIEVDISGNPVNQDAQMTQAAHYSRLMSSGDEIGGTGEPQINVDVLEDSTINGLFNHFINNLKLGEMDEFLRGVRSYFRRDTGDMTWLNDNNYGLSDSSGNQTILESETTPFTYRYTQGGTHLLSRDLMMDPRKFMNDNQYIAMARKILYDRKVSTGEKILNPETIPKADLILLGKINHKIKLLNDELNNKYLSEDERTEITTKINRLNQKGSLLITDIENREKVFDRTVKEERSRPFRQNDSSYVPFRNNTPSTYTTSRGQVLDTPAGVGGNF